MANGIKPSRVVARTRERNSGRSALDDDFDGPTRKKNGWTRVTRVQPSYDDSPSSVEDPIRRLLKSFKKQYIAEATEGEKRERTLNKYLMDPAGTWLPYPAILNTWLRVSVIPIIALTRTNTDRAICRFKIAKITRPLYKISIVCFAETEHHVQIWTWETWRHWSNPKPLWRLIV